MILLLCALTGVGCLDVDTFDYEEYVQPLDADNELTVSTYPAWVSRQSVSWAPVYVRLSSDDYLALQFHIRDIAWTLGQKQWS